MTVLLGIGSFILGTILYALGSFLGHNAWVQKSIDPKVSGNSQAAKTQQNTQLIRLCGAALILIGIFLILAPLFVK